MAEVSAARLCGGEQRAEEQLKTATDSGLLQFRGRRWDEHRKPTSSTGGALPPILSTQRARRVAVAVALGGGLALGVAGLAQAADTPAPSGSAAPSAGTAGPGRGAGHEHAPHLAGTVKSISDTRILITDRDGFTRQINITSKPDGVAVGTRIHAVGTVNADGVSLDATSVVVAPEGEGKRDGGWGHRGGGGPDGRGPGGWGPGGERGGPPAAPSTPPSAGSSAPVTPPSAGSTAPSAPAPSAS
jgi:hypothetical protein